VKNLEDVCFVINARMGSSRLPGKMLKPFADTSLFELAINKVTESSFPTRQFFVSLRDEELKQIANQNNINIYHRSGQSVRKDNVVPFTLPEVFEWWEDLSKNYKYYILMNACCPLIEVSTINSFIEEFISSNASGLFSVVEHKRFFYRGDSSIINDFHGSEEAKITFNTKFVEPLYSAAPLRAGILKDIGSHKYMGTFESPADPPLWKVNAIEATDVDYEEEFLFAETLYKSRKKR